MSKIIIIVLLYTFDYQAEYTEYNLGSLLLISLVAEGC